ncbi:MAG TPA: hypothetical protein VKV36_04485 [Acidimicrobiales bacterium]|nr:hypothetical protein [Acidimicrobiales bacterium]
MPAGERPAEGGTGGGEPLIVLVGGTAGCGKTTLANHLLARLDLDHRIGTGFIRAVVQSEVGPGAEPGLFMRTYEGPDPVATVRAQAERLLPAVQACLARARNEGTSLVVEGTHLLPELYHGEGLPFVVLEPPRGAEHARRLAGQRHTRRPVGPGDVQGAQAIGEHYRAQARRYGIPTMVYADNLDEIVAAVLAHPGAPGSRRPAGPQRSRGKVPGMSSAADHDHEIKIKGGSFSLSDLGELMPGMAEIMPLIGERIWKCYYAGRARNKPLARFQLAEAVNLMEKGAILRPKYAEDLESFIGEMVAGVRQCIEEEDWNGFEAAFAKMVDSANGYHEKYDKGFLRWKVPEQPPPDLDMTPRG